MERNSSVKEVHKLLNQDYPELYKTLCAKLGESNPFAKFSIGAGNYVWSDSRHEWHRMSDASELKQCEIQDALNRTKAFIAEKIGPKTAEALFTVPDNSYICYNEDNDEMKILLTGWGFKKPVRVVVDPEIEKIKQKNPINVSFSFAGVRLKNYEFGLRLAKQVKRLNTGSNGLYVFDDLKVGENYVVTDLNSNKEFSLNIIEGQSLYDFDVTKYTTLSISATSDGEPISNEKVDILYHGKNYDAVTDENGQAQIQIPFLKEEVVNATMRDKLQTTQIAEDGGKIEFVFETEEPEGDTPPRIHPHLVVKRENGDVVGNYPISIEYDGTVNDYTSNSEGIVELPEMESGKSMTAIDRNNPDNKAEYNLNNEQEEYVFLLPEEPTVEKRNIKVMFRNQQGNPIACNNILFHQEGKPDLIAQLDENGDTYFKEDTFTTETPITASINGESNVALYPPIPFSLDKGEYEYLIQEKEPQNSAWWPLVLEILAGLIAIALLWLLWPYFENFCHEMFNRIYH